MGVIGHLPFLIPSLIRLDSSNKLAADSSYRHYKIQPRFVCLYFFYIFRCGICKYVKTNIHLVVHSPTSCVTFRVTSPRSEILHYGIPCEVGLQ